MTAPKSATDLRVNTVGLTCMLAVTALVLWREVDPAVGIVLLMCAAAAPILLLDVLVTRVHLRATTGLDWTLSRPRDLRRILTRWLGGIAAVSPVLAVYALAPEYQGDDFYGAWYRFLRWFAPLALVFTAAYLAWIDRWLADPHDTYWLVGAAITRQAAPDREAIGQAVRTWLIKGFFVPLMFVYAVGHLTDLQRVLASDREPFWYWFDALWNVGFLVDVVFTTMGYLTTLRIFDTHVRSAEPTMKGWVVALCCYQPFFSLLARQYLLYETGMDWRAWLAPHPAVRVAWGVTILVLLLIFSASTVTFGCRFSNLTHRGILTNGPYRWTRHPAYVSKCTSFWLIFVPFVYRGSWYEVVRDCSWLAALCGIYWLRARTEERHLSRDPAYVAYATRMNRESLFAPIGRWFPALAFRPPA